MKKLAIFVHGINTIHAGEKTLDRLVPYFTVNGYDRKDCDWGWGLVLRSTFKYHETTTAIRNMILQASQDGYEEVVLIGHSHGCSLIYGACSKLPPRNDKTDTTIINAVLINPALNPHILPPNVHNAHVYHSKHDFITTISGIVFPLNWGSMGHNGFIEKGKRYQNVTVWNGINVRNYDEEAISGYKWIGHSDIFAVDKIKFFGEFIVDQLKPSA